MKVVRASAQQAHKQAKQTHKAVIKQHKTHNARLDEANSVLLGIHEEEKQAHEERLSAHAEECERIDAKHEEQLKFYEEYEQQRVERDKKLAEIKKKLPKPLPFPPPDWVCELLNWPKHPLPKIDKPEHPGYFTEPSAPEEPLLAEIHPEPEIHFPEPAVFNARQVTGDEYEEVQTTWGKTLASPGSWVLTNEVHGCWIVPDETFQKEYNKA